MEYIRKTYTKCVVKSLIRLYRGSFSKLFNKGDVLWKQGNMVYSDTGLIIDIDSFNSNISNIEF